MVGLLGCGCCEGDTPGPSCQNGYVEQFAYPFDTIPSELQFVTFPNHVNGNWAIDSGRLKSTSTGVRFGSQPTNRSVRCQFQTYEAGQTSPYSKITVSVDYQLQPIPTLRCANQIKLNIDDMEFSGVDVFVQVEQIRVTSGGPVENWAFFSGPVSPQPPIPVSPTGSIVLSCEQVAPGSLTWNWSAAVNGVSFPFVIPVTRANPKSTHFGGGVCCDFYSSLFHQLGVFETGPVILLSAWFDNFTQTFTPQ